MEAVVDAGVDCDCEDGTGRPPEGAAAAEDALDCLLTRDDRLTGAERDLGAVGGLVGDDCGVLTGEDCGVLTGEAGAVLAGEDWVEPAGDECGDAGHDDVGVDAPDTLGDLRDIGTLL